MTSMTTLGRTSSKGKSYTLAGHCGFHLGICLLRETQEFTVHFGFLLALNFEWARLLPMVFAPVQSAKAQLLPVAPAQLTVARHG